MSGERERERERERKREREREADSKRWWRLVSTICLEFGQAESSFFFTSRSINIFLRGSRSINMISYMCAWARKKYTP
jgi:hypothetical protein